jgi:ATP-dependent RNA helicase RhlE
VSPEEEGELRAIERALGKSLPRVTLPGFDYARRPKEKLEIPLAERLRAHRAARGRKAGSGPAAARGRPRARKPPKDGGREARLQAILDRHAPLSGEPAGRRGPRRGRR